MSGSRVWLCLALVLIAASLGCSASSRTATPTLLPRSLINQPILPSIQAPAALPDAAAASPGVTATVATTTTAPTPSEDEDVAPEIPWMRKLPWDTPDAVLAEPAASATCSDLVTATPSPLTPLQTLSLPQRIHLPILVYHHIQEVSINSRAILRALSVSPLAFEQQMAFLAAQQYNTILFPDLVAFFHEGRPLPEKPILLTFDDAWVNQYTVAFPILQKYGFRGTFFPPTNWVGRTATVLSWAEIKEMSDAGMEFGSHTQSHALMALRTGQQNRGELINSKRILEQHTGRPVVALAYPGGSFNNTVLQLVPQCGYEAAVSTNGGVYQSPAEIYRLRRTGIRYTDTLEMFAAKLE